MTRGQLEKKILHLERNIKYYCRVYPGSEKIQHYKSIYRHYKKQLIHFINTT